MPTIYDLINSNDSLGLKNYLESNKNELELLVSRVVDQHHEQLTPLQYAALKNKFESMKVIVEMGGNPFSQSEVKLSTPLHYAVSHMNYDAVVLLLDSLRDDEKKALIKMRDRFGKTVLHYLIDNAEKNPEIAILIYDKLLASIPGNYRSRFLNKVDKTGQSALFVLVFKARKEDKATDSLIAKFVGELVDLKLGQLTVTQYSVMKLMPSAHLSELSKQRLVYAHSRQQIIDSSSKTKVVANSEQVTSSYTVVTQLSLQDRIDRDSKEIAEQILNYDNGVCAWFDNYLVNQSRFQGNQHAVNTVLNTQSSTEMSARTRTQWKNELQPSEKPKGIRFSIPDGSDRQVQQAAGGTSRVFARHSRADIVLNRTTAASKKHKQAQQLVDSTASTAMVLQLRNDNVAMAGTTPSVNVRA